jgi:uncharacterized protein
MTADAQFLTWRGLDAWRVEAATVTLAAEGLIAEGTQIGSDPVPYRLDYRLDASEGFVTRSLVVTARGQGWWREVSLQHDGNGAWTCEGRAEGALDAPEPGGDVATFAGAVDCDLGYSPVTNFMPIRRSGLNRRAGAEDFLMAWVSVPDLSVVGSGQRYEHVRMTDHGSVVRYVDRGLFDGFTAELELDRDGVVVVYPELAERVGDESSET